MPVFVKYYPAAIKAFYMPIISDDEIKRVDNFDMLMPNLGEVDRKEFQIMINC